LRFEGDVLCKLGGSHNLAKGDIPLNCFFVKLKQNRVGA
jgi:hypothetical protein